MSNSHSAAANAQVQKTHVLPDNLFVMVWVGLLILTGITVAGSVYFPGKVGILIAMIVTPIKAALILMFFMHLRYEKKGFTIMFLVAVGILGIFIGLTFFDYLFR
jgi:cytochrome c oxidase subunit 4